MRAHSIEMGDVRCKMYDGRWEIPPRFPIFSNIERIIKNKEL
jgi:hypothetical protein